MKKSLTLIVASLVAFAVTCRAGSPIDFRNVAVDTNAAAVTTSTPTPGYMDDVRAEWADTVIISFSGYASPTCTVALVTAEDPADNNARTIFTKTGLTADASFPLRDIVTTQLGVDIANTPARVPLFARVRCQAYAANSTGVVVNVRLVTSPTP